MEHKTQNQPKPNIVRTRHYNCAYVKVLIIFPVILQTVVNICLLEDRRACMQADMSMMSVDAII